VLRALVERLGAEELASAAAGHAAEIVHLVPELRTRLSHLGPEAAIKSTAGRFRLFHAVARFLRRASAARTLVVVLDDLHDADEASLILLQFLVREISTDRILVVGTLRDATLKTRTSLAATVAAVDSASPGRSIALQGLDPQAVRDFVHGAMESAPSDAVLAVLRDQTGGNPLLLGHVVELMAAAGADHARDALASLQSLGRGR
jgi:predicted ATPase